MSESRLTRLLRLLPLLAVLAAFAWSCVVILTRRSDEAPADTTVIRMAHWQLEAGVREALEQLGNEYAALPSTKARFGKVKITQDAIPEGTYGQWVTCQMVGGIAPDLIEMGMGLPVSLWLKFKQRYFYPLTDLAHLPNPYNHGTDLARTPLRQTLSNDMRNGYVDEMQEYMQLPLSCFTMRLFYNKTLLRQLTGRDTPPANYREFLKVCQQIAATRDHKGEPRFPVAASKYHMWIWNSMIFDPMTYGVLAQADFNRDGGVGSDELYAALRTGRLSFEDPSVRAKFQLLREIMTYAQPGYTGQTRDDALFLFAQQKAVFIGTGTWDSMSLVRQAGSRFEVGIMRFPLPAGDDPEYGPLMVGSMRDFMDVGFAFGVTRFSRNPECAKDFLLFLASRNINARLNAIIGWIPTTKGAPVPTELREFVPNEDGMFTCLPIDGLGSRTITEYQQQFALFQTDARYTYRQFCDRFGTFYRTVGMQDYMDQQRDWAQRALNRERDLAVLRTAALGASSETAPRAWHKYRASNIWQALAPLERDRQTQMVVAGPQRPVGPYEFLPEVAAEIKRRGPQGRQP